MDADDVALLARHEQDLWGRGGPAEVPAPPPGPGAYAPLGADPAAVPPGPPQPRVRFLGATALGTVLAFRFRWPPDAADRDLLLLLDFRHHPGDVTAASTWVLEHVEQRIHHDTSWFPRDLVPISDAAALVRTARQPGRG
jgi:hypothetical protein